MGSQEDIQSILTRPEHQVLLRSLRLGIEVDPAPLRAELKRVTDWDYLLQAALQQGVFSTFYHRVADSCPEAVPPEFLTELQRLYGVNTRTNLKMTGELLQVLNLLESHGIPAVPFKGPVLAATVYGDIAMRQFIDLDLLVRRQDILKVKDLLLSAGYELRNPLTPKQEQVHFRRANEFTFTHSHRTMLDVHWRFVAGYLGGGPDADTALARSIPVSLEGKAVSSLEPGDMLLMLCLHGDFHLWPSLGAVNDVAHLVQAQGPWDWPALIKRAEGLGLRRILLLGLSLAGELLSAPVPPKVAALADRDPEIQALRRQVLEKLFARNGNEPPLLETIRFHVRSRERFRDRLHYVWVRGLVPTVEDWKWVPLPDYCYWLYFPLRPLRLAVQGFLLPLLRRLKT